MAASAFIGLGQMGSPMASNLLQQGHQLRVFDVNAEAVRHLVDKGATPAANPAQAAKDAEFIITMLPNGDLVRNVLFGENGVCEGLSTDALVIDMSTIHPLQTDKLIADMQAKGFSMMDVPVGHHLSVRSHPYQSAKSPEYQDFRRFTVRNGSRQIVDSRTP